MKKLCVKCGNPIGKWKRKFCSKNCYLLYWKQDKIDTLRKIKREYQREYNHRPEVKKRKKEWLKNHLKKYSPLGYYSNYCKLWRKKNKDYHKEYKKTEKYKKVKNKRRRIRHKTDKNYDITYRLKFLLWYALKSYTKTGKIKKSGEYGIDYNKIIEHLKPFPKDLSNYEIHHIKPLHTFSFVNKDCSTNLKEVSKAFAPENHILLTLKEHKEMHRKLNHKGLINGN